MIFLCQNCSTIHGHLLGHTPHDGFVYIDNFSPTCAYVITAGHMTTMKNEADAAQGIRGVDYLMTSETDGKDLIDEVG